MFNQNIRRIGFACKIQESHDRADPKLNTKTTTLTWLNNQPRDKSVEKLWTVLTHNVAALRAQFNWLAKQPHSQRQFRMSSDLFPVYTHDLWTWWYFEPDVQRYIQREFAVLGELARQHDIRLSFHPGQFCVLASENPNVVDNSVMEFEYHCDIIRAMGFGQQFQDFKCNVHIGGKQGPEGIKRALKRLSREARNVLTIENAEYTWGLDASLDLVDHCALVLDIHHHLLYTKGEYISCDDDRVKRVIDSWRGVRPVIHYSVSREDVLVEHCKDTKPNIQDLLAIGISISKLRAHSDYYWNKESNEWAKSFNKDFDIMLESKQKNIARDKFIASISV